ncbi:MAG: alpha/beta hydrolase [Proteobacteria bacterium]|nr:alpha/beta hydrolase [Pseudomonadota bacterium]
MGALSALFHFVRALLLVLVRRPFAGPKRPSWTVTYEIAIETLRSRFRGEVDLARARRDYDSLGLAEDLRRRVRVEVQESTEHEWVSPRESPASGQVVFYLHGGGYVMGSPRSHRGLMADLALATSSRVLAVDYRLAPEHACPAAIEDALEAWKWLIQTEEPSQVIVAGDSAGGGLALAFLMALRDSGLPLPAGAVVLSPWADLAGPYPPSPSEYDYLPPSTLAEFADHYAGGLPLSDPRVSPVHGDFAGLPPLFISAGGDEVLLDGIRRAAALAQEAGVEVTFEVGDEEIHVYQALSEVREPARRSLERIATWMRERVPAGG